MDGPAHRGGMTHLNTNRTLLRQGIHGCSALFLCLLAGAELPAPGTSDTSYMQQFSGALRRSHPSAYPVLVDVLVDLGNKGVKLALRRLIPVHFGALRMTPSPFQPDMSGLKKIQPPDAANDFRGFVVSGILLEN